MSVERSLTGVRGLLLDLDGTLYEPRGVVAGAPATVERARSAGLQVRFITNTTRTSRAAVAARLEKLGISARKEELFSAPMAARAWLEEHGVRTVSLYIPAEAAGEFSRFTVTDHAPDAVVVGDLGSGWSFDRLNQAFRQVRAGARLVAIQKNRYWRDADGLSLDAGPFVAALEYASDATAVTVGKPNPAFFAAAAQSMHLRLEEVVVVGDDIVTDVAGGKRAGAQGVLVCTGKWTPDDERRSIVTPDAVIPSIADLPRLLGF